MVREETDLRQLLGIAQTVDVSSALYRRATEVLDRIETTGTPFTLRPEPAPFATPILRRMEHIEGWFSATEAELLIAAASWAIARLPQADALVEVGSYCGRSTCALAGAAQALGSAAKVYAIDPHLGYVGATDVKIEMTAPTRQRLETNLRQAGLAEQVVIIQVHSWEVNWTKPVGLLFIDGLHDYDNVVRDFNQFEGWLCPGGYAAFHDYGGSYPGVTKVVDEILGSGHYRAVRCAGSLFVMKKTVAGIGLPWRGPR